MADAAKEKALQLIPQLTELQLLEVCDNLDLKLKTDLKVSRKQALKNKLIRYLASEDIEESEDNGLAVFMKLIEDMQALVVEDEADDTKSSSGLMNVQKFEAMVGDGGPARQDAGRLQRLLEGLGLTSGEPSKQEVSGALASLLNSGGQSQELDGALKELGQIIGNSSKERMQTGDSGASNRVAQVSTDGHVTKSRVVHRLKEFKIDGKIGHGESPLTFQNIKYQIADAENLEYQWKEIMSAMIKAMKSGSSIRNYFERNPELEKEEFLDMLESLLDEEKESSDLVLEMKSKVQGTDEKVEDYVLDMVSLKKQIVKESFQEGSPVDEELAWKWCSRAILEGLRHDAIRQEMRTILSQSSTQGPDLMKQVKRLVKMEEEHRRKTGEDDRSSSNSTQKLKNIGKKNAEVNQLSVSGGFGNQNVYGDKKKTVTFNEPCNGEGFEKLNAKLDLIVNQMGECVEVIPVVRGLEKDVKALQKEMKDFKDKPMNGRRVPKCEECKKTNAFCRHCANCGEDGHKQGDCPKPKN